SPTGTQRLAVISGRDPGAIAQRPPAPSRQAEPAGRPAEPEAETRRLAETVRKLAADRDHLLGRIEALERSLDVTGSIPRDNGAARDAATRDNAARDSAAPPPASSAPTLPPGWSLVPNTMPPAAGVPVVPAPHVNALPGGSAGQAPATAPGAAATSGLSGSEQAAGSVATKTEFGVDI